MTIVNCKRIMTKQVVKVMNFLYKWSLQCITKIKTQFFLILSTSCSIIKNFFKNFRHNFVINFFFIKNIRYVIFFILSLK